MILCYAIHILIIKIYTLTFSHHNKKYPFMTEFKTYYVIKLYMLDVDMDCKSLLILETLHFYKIVLSMVEIVFDYSDMDVFVFIICFSWSFLPLSHFCYNLIGCFLNPVKWSEMASIMESVFVSSSVTWIDFLFHQMLMKLGVKRLVLPAVSDMLETWTNSFGFVEMTSSERRQFLDYAFLDFPETVMCQKLLRSPSPDSVLTTGL